MAVVIRSLFNYYHYLFNEHIDTRVSQYYLLNSPLPVITIVGLYLYFVLSWGPEWMKNRKPYDLTRTMMVFNLFQILANLFIGTYGFYYSYLQKDFSLTCQKIEHKNTVAEARLLFATYLYFLVKITDLLDTVFFVLRKRNNQISFLHVYHHAGMVIATYIFNKFMSGSHPTMLGLINAHVHVIMYSYYFLTSFKPELKKSIWWKKHITQIQLVQFFYLIIHFTIPIFNNCKFPRAILFVGVIQNLFMFSMFCDFYIKTYLRNKQPKLE